MPTYTFLNEETGEIKDIIMSMNDKHEYIDKTGYKWTRIFYVPQSSIDSRIDPNNPKDFVSKTSNKKGTLGDLFDISAELSHKRGGVTGKDPVKESYYEKYKKKVGGKPHFDKVREKAKEKLDKMGVVVET